jgi:dihydroorotate dehydrogenase
MRDNYHEHAPVGAKLPRGVACLGASAAWLLRLLPPERAHHLALALLRSKLLAKIPSSMQQPLFPRLSCSVPGWGQLPHPIGLAAGFDKNANCFAELARLGFSFLEVGTLTPRAQAGNPLPRIFRLSAERALINRMGFNNDGLDVISARLKVRRPLPGAPLLGVNIGMNKSTPLAQASADYLTSFKRLKEHADYFVVNISSPNTPSLRSLANPYFIAELAQKIAGEIDPALLSKVWIKLDPDLERKDLQALVSCCVERRFAGLVLTNTHKVERPWTGGLSGHPLAIASSARLEWAWQVHRGSLPMIGCGGILSGEDILQKIMRGAACVQIYTAMIYRGPWVVWELLQELEDAMALRGFSTLAEAYEIYYQQ